MTKDSLGLSEEDRVVLLSLASNIASVYFDNVEKLGGFTLGDVCVVVSCKDGVYRLEAWASALEDE